VVSLANPKKELPMPIIKIHLEYAEHDAVERLADAIKVTPEA
jgi:hypothetical protein